MASDQPSQFEELFADSAVPTDRPCEYLDARELPPPEPLRRTLERVEAVEEVVLVQLNDRVPQHLYPRLDDREYQYQTRNEGETVVTAIWEV